MNQILGFDLGTRRMGVAIGNTVTASARPLDVVPVRERQPDWTQVDELVRAWRPVALVVGLPLARDGGEQAMSRQARHLADALGARSRLPVHLHDERHTSQEAARRFAAARAAGTRRRRDARLLDAEAAAVILESWLSAHPAPGR